MACDQWRWQIERYADGEMNADDAGSFEAHLRSCASCAAEVVSAMQLKHGVSLAGNRYQPSAQLRARIAATVRTRRERPSRWWWSILAIPALTIVLLSVGVSLYVQSGKARRQQVFSEIADLHVAALASATPVDVVSSDRHTVKPWFQGRLPFTFNLPELQGTEFTLLGGRVTYLGQTPGAQLIYRLRQHEISVFIFQDRSSPQLPSGAAHALSFNFANWTQDGLRYFVIGDASAEDIDSLSKLLRGA